ncbi:MAG: hypothetical protein IT177_13125 [Acidobacteria bacterium]|nr:hypothetical protein [Acidobacteriota bacterium]
MARRTPAEPSRPDRRSPPGVPAKEASTGRPGPRSHTAPAPRPATAPAAVRPDVIVDFSVERGVLFVSLRNIGAASAYKVVTRFDQPFRGLGGTRDVPALALFRALPFMPPGKQFTHLVDPLAVYLQRGEPTRLTATITYTDRDGHGYSETVPHDLEVYRELAEAIPR